MADPTPPQVVETEAEPAQPGPAPAAPIIEPEGQQSLGQIFRRLGPAGVLGVIALSMPALLGIVLLGSLGVVGEWLKAQGASGPFIYAGAFALLAGLALLPTYAQAILGGWAFGVWVGFGAALGGFAGASLIGYLIARRVSGDRVKTLIEEKPRWAAVRRSLLGDDDPENDDALPVREAGFWKTTGIITLIRIPPNSPFALTNLLLASVHVPIAAYLIGTIVGMAPRTFAAVYLASQIEGALSTEAIRPPWWQFALGIAIAVAVLLVIGAIANRAIRRVTGGVS